MHQEGMSDYRCSCGKLLFKGRLVEARVEVKCKHCRGISSFLGVGGERGESVIAAR